MTTRVRRTIAALVSAALLSLLTSMFVAVPAHAQDDPVVTVSSHEIDDQTSTFVATLSLNPGSNDLGAVHGDLTWNVNSVGFVGCTAAELAVCNDNGGSMAWAGIAPDGFSAISEFVTVEFVVLDRSQSTDLKLTIDTAVNVLGEPTSGEGVDGVVEFARDLGSINGEVVDGFGDAFYNAEVCALAAGGTNRCVNSNALGAFVIDNLPTGTYRMVVSDPAGVLPPTDAAVDVAAPAVTTGVVLTLSATPEADPAPAGQPDAPAAPPAPIAGPGQIIGQVLADDGTGSAIFGAEVCATAPLIGAQACGFTDVDGVVVLTVDDGNYELTASDPAGRWDPAVPTFVGVNPGAGVNAEISMAPLGLGETPGELAFVDAESTSQTTSIVLTGLAFAVLGVGAGLTTRRRR